MWLEEGTIYIGTEFPYAKYCEQHVILKKLIKCHREGKKQPPVSYNLRFCW